MAVVRSGVPRGAPPAGRGAQPAAAPARPRVDHRIGQVLGGRYRLLTPIGTGASASVFLADDVTLRRRVAIKLLHPALADDDAFLRRFRAEAQAAAALNHPHVMSVYDWNGDDETPFLVMEYLEGGSLRALLDVGDRLSPSQALLVGLETARGLDYAHRRGFVHRDIKPANLLFDEEARVRIADFGLARALAEAAWTEPMGAVLGTARYASPEQARGESLDGRSDVYSLAIVLIEAVTGLVPFAVDTTIGTLMARVDRDLPVPDGLGPLTPVLEAAGRCHPRERLDAAEFGAALLLAAEGLDRPEPLPLAGALADGAQLVVDRDPTEVQAEPSASAPTGPSAAPGTAAERSSRKERRRARKAGAAVAAGAAGSPVVGGAAGTTGALPGAAGSTIPLDDGEPEPVWAADELLRSAPVAVVAPGEASPDGGPVLYDVDLDSDLGFGTGPNPILDLRDAGDAGDAGEVVAVDAAAHRALAEPTGAGAGDETELGLEPEAAVVAPELPPDATRKERKAARKDAEARAKAAEAAARARARDDAAAAKAQRKADKAAAKVGRKRWPRVVGVLVVLGLIAGAVGYWYVELRIPRYPVPDLVSRDLPSAEALAATNGWRITRTDDRRDGTRAGEILAQSPAPGTDLLRDGTLALTVSLGNTLVAVPTDLVGVTQEAAGQRLAASELVVGEITQVNDEDIPAGTVVSLGPGTPAQLPKGSGVPLIVSKGPVPRTIPDGLAGVPADNAVARLKELGLVPTQVQVFSDTAPVGQSTGTQPNAGAQVEKGSSVTVYVSKGPQLIAVPPVAGRSVIDAASVIEGSRLKVAGTQGSPTQPVTGTVPAAGTMVRPGTAVTLVTG